MVVVPGHRWCPGPWTNQRRDSALTSLPWFCLVPGPGWQGRGDLTLTYAVRCSEKKGGPTHIPILFLFHIICVVVLFILSTRRSTPVPYIFYFILLYFIEKENEATVSLVSWCGGGISSFTAVGSALFLSFSPFL